MTMRWLAVALVAAVEMKHGGSGGAVRLAMEPAGVLLLGSGVLGGAMLRGRLRLLHEDAE